MVLVLNLDSSQIIGASTASTNNLHSFGLGYDGLLAAQIALHG